MSSPSNAAGDNPKRNGTASAVKPSSVYGLYPGARNEDSSRRSFFKMTLRGAVAGLATATGMEFVAARRVLAQTALTPDSALQELMDGNRRFSAENLTSFEHDLAILKQDTIDKQEPFAAVLSCADSRVPV